MRKPAWTWGKERESLEQLCDQPTPLLDEPRSLLKGKGKDAPYLDVRAGTRVRQRVLDKVKVFNPLRQTVWKMRKGKARV